MKAVNPVTTDVPEVPASSSSSTDERYRATQDSPDFGRLRTTLRNFVFPMTVAFFLWYLLYVLLSAYARGFMGAKVAGNVNVALIFGLLQFVSTFLIAWYYSRYAAQKIDPLADSIKAGLDSGSPSRSIDDPETDTDAGSDSDSGEAAVK